jgi:L-alanine-DL-glutamate epimerase-like enolase superfamily enzyme
MRLVHQPFDLRLRDPWAISGTSASSGGKRVHPVVFVQLEDARGRRGLGEASPSSQYQEDVHSVSRFLVQVDASRLSFDRLTESAAYLDSIQPASPPARCALDLALLDGAARSTGMPVHEFLGVGFTEGRHVTSFSLGIDTPEIMARKAAAAVADGMGLLKVKVGVPADRENLSALMTAAPGVPIRVDANAAWGVREEALRHIEWLAATGRVEFVEQPMPPALPDADWIWLKERSPLPLIGDELYQTAADAPRCARCVHGVNVKLVKTGGLTGALHALRAARELGLKTMLGCMIESSLLITAAAHLADLTDYLDLDGNLLISNDPFAGVRCVGGRLGFEGVADRCGLRVTHCALDGGVFQANVPA